MHSDSALCTTMQLCNFHQTNHKSQEAMDQVSSLLEAKVGRETVSLIFHWLQHSKFISKLLAISCLHLLCAVNTVVPDVVHLRATVHSANVFGIGQAVSEQVYTT